MIYLSFFVKKRISWIGRSTIFDPKSNARANLSYFLKACTTYLLYYLPVLLQIVSAGISVLFINISIGWTWGSEKSKGSVTVIRATSLSNWGLLWSSWCSMVLIFLFWCPDSRNLSWAPATICSRISFLKLGRHYD